MNVELSDTQVKWLKTAVKNNTGTTSRNVFSSLKMFDGNDLPHVLLLSFNESGCSFG